MENELLPRRLSIRRVVVSIALGVTMFVFGFGLRGLITKSATSYQLLTPLGEKTPEAPANPYLPFRFSALRSLILSPEPITILGVLDQSQPSYHSFLVAWDVPNLETKQKDRVTGQLNIPTGEGPFPAIVMLRGYVEREEYRTGTGTRNAAAAFAQNGFVTIAPDFLGYGGSDAESSDVLIARFAKPLTVLQLLTDLKSGELQLDPDLTADPLPTVRNIIDQSRLGLWAHSNGGQIALSVLEITSQVLPTSLWAPVSQSFPYNVLYYSNDAEDQGRYLRQQLANFEFTLDNDPAEWSALTEPSRILAPLQIHQGGRDDAVPLAWSEQLTAKLEAATVSAKLYTYPQADHNLQPDWSTAVQRDLQFFARHLKNN